MTHGPVWLVTGVPGAGKTTVAAELCRRYPRAFHVRVDELGEWAVASDVDRAVRRGVRRRGVVALAVVYRDGGFTVVIDDTIEREADIAEYAPLGALRRVHLLPTLKTALERNRARTNKPAGDAPMLDAIARRLYQQMRRDLVADRGWLVIPTDALTPAQTVDAILAAFGGSPD